MQLFQICTSDPCTALGQLSWLFLQEHQPAVIFYNSSSDLTQLDQLVRFYDVMLQTAPDPAPAEDTPIVVYTPRYWSLVLEVFPLLAGRAIFYERSQAPPAAVSKCWLLGDCAPLDQARENVRLADSAAVSSLYPHDSGHSLVMVNSADLHLPEQGRQSEDADLFWGAGFSLLGAYVAALRPARLWDVASTSPDAQEIEEQLTQTPWHSTIEEIVVVGTCGALPLVTTYPRFFNLGDSYRTDLIRDYALRQGPYYRTRQGRLLGRNVLDAALLFQRTNLRHKRRPTPQRQGLVCADSHTCLEECGVAVAVPMLRTSARLVARELTQRGYQMRELFGRDNSHANLQRYLPHSWFCFVANHGIMMYLRTSGKSFGSTDLPLVPPLEFFCLSCLTSRLKGLWFSDEGHHWRYLPLPVVYSLPLQAIHQGVSLFVGLMNFGLETEANITFLDTLRALIIQGEDIGTAVRQARNNLVASNQALLATFAPEQIGFYELLLAYQELTTSEFAVYGDPATRLPVPPGSTTNAEVSITAHEQHLQVDFQIAPQAWQEEYVQLDDKAQQAYYTKAWHTYYPAVPQAVLSRGLPLQRDAQTGIAAVEISKYDFLVCLDLPAGHTVTYIELVQAYALEEEGNLHTCFGTHYLSTSPYAPLCQVALADNFPFALEPGPRPQVRIFVPTIALNAQQQVRRLRSARLHVHHAPAQLCRIQLRSAADLPLTALLTFTHSQGWFRKLHTHGTEEIRLAAGTYQVRVSAPLHQPQELALVVSSSEVHLKVTLEPTPRHQLVLRLVDGAHKRPVKNVHLELALFVGPPDVRWFQDYQQGKERYPHLPVQQGQTDAHGTYTCQLPTGLYAVHITVPYDPAVGERYLPLEERIELQGDMELCFSLTPAAMLCGELIDAATGEGLADAAVLVARVPEKSGQQPKFARHHTDFQGHFRIPVTAGEPLVVLGAFEGYQMDPQKVVVPRGEEQNIRLLCQRTRASAKLQPEQENP